MHMSAARRIRTCIENRSCQTKIPQSARAPRSPPCQCPRTMNHRFFHAALATLIACGSAQKAPTTPPPAATPVAPTAAAATTTAADAPLPLWPKVKRGKLDNGLTYYIFPHQRPEKRALLWLAVNAGSVQEDDDQRGLAHFVEHMAFNGTKRFPKNDIIHYIESIGQNFGADLNAYTSWDETVYTLEVPTDDPKDRKSVV